MMGMERRKLEFNSYEEVIAELERLKDSENEQLGNWKLGDICFHLNFYFTGSLNGFKVMLPWVIRTFMGRPALWWLLRHEYKPGGTTVPKSIPKGDNNIEETVNITIGLLKLLSEAKELQPSSFFGTLTVDQWREMHLRHAAHHLSFLTPKPS